MDELAAALDNMRAGHGHLGIWIEDSRGRQVYGGEPPVILERLAGNEVELHAPDGSRMRGLRVALDERLAPGAVLTVAVGVGAGARLLYAYGTALLLICALWVGATVMLAAWAVRRSMAPLAGCRNRLRASSPTTWPCACHCTTPTANCRISCVPSTARWTACNRPTSRWKASMPTWPRAAHAAGHPDQRHPGHAVLARDAAELRDALESNLEVLEDLKTMVNDMLFLARADRGERADRSAISLAAEARRVADTTTPRWKSAASACVAKATRPSRPIPVWCAARWPT